MIREKIEKDKDGDGNDEDTAPGETAGAEDDPNGAVADGSNPDKLPAETTSKAAAIAAQKAPPMPPKASPKAGKNGKRKLAAKAPPAKRSKVEPKIWTTKPPVPKIGDAPILCKTSKIYVSASKNTYRIIRDAFNFSSERQITFAKHGKPTPSTWKQALKVVDDYIRSKK